MNISKTLNTLRTNGYRITKARKNIVALLAGSTTPLGAKTINKKLTRKGLAIDKATIYRELHFLEEKNIIQQCTQDSKETKYSTRKTSTEAHCTKCNKLIHLCKEFEKQLESFQKKIENTNHFKIVSQQNHIHGLCNNCK